MSVRRRYQSRRGAATAELAVVVPFLVFLVLIAVDFGRIFFLAVTLSNCARNGAMYEADSYLRAESKYTSTEQAALADAESVVDPNNPLTVTTTSGTDTSGYQYVEVTVSRRFQTVSKFPGIPDDVNVSRTVRMARAPMNPTSP